MLRSGAGDHWCSYSYDEELIINCPRQGCYLKGGGAYYGMYNKPTCTHDRILEWFMSYSSQSET